MIAICRDIVTVVFTIPHGKHKFNIYDTTYSLLNPDLISIADHGVHGEKINLLYILYISIFGCILSLYCLSL